VVYLSASSIPAWERHDRGSRTIYDLAIAVDSSRLHYEAGGGLLCLAPLLGGTFCWTCLNRPLCVRRECRLQSRCCGVRWICGFGFLVSSSEVSLIRMYVVSVGRDRGLSWPGLCMYVVCVCVAEQLAARQEIATAQAHGRWRIASGPCSGGASASCGLKIHVVQRWMRTVAIDSTVAWQECSLPELFSTSETTQGKTFVYGLALNALASCHFWWMCWVLCAIVRAAQKWYNSDTCFSTYIMFFDWFWSIWGCWFQIRCIPYCKCWAFFLFHKKVPQNQENMVFR